MYELKSVDVWSCAKVAGVVYGCMSLLLLPIVLLSIAMSAGSAQPFGVSTAVALTLLAIFAPLVYVVLGMLFGVLSAWIYNVTAKWVGGLRLNLQGDGIAVNPPRATGSV